MRFGNPPPKDELVTQLRSQKLVSGGDFVAEVSHSPGDATLDAIREFKVTTNPYAAELGGSPGAVINVPTKGCID
jgi:hypothetical protein